MRNAALERDDSIFPFSILISLIVHGALLFVVILPQVEAKPIEDWIYAHESIQYQTFPEAAEFLRHSTTQRIYSASTTGITQPTTGNVRIEPERLREEPSREVPPRGVQNPSEVPSVDNRFFVASRNVEPGATQEVSDPASGQNRPARTSSYRTAVAAPEGPDAIVPQWDDRYARNPAGTAPSNEPSGATSQLRTGRATSPDATQSDRSGGFTRGVLDGPDRPLTMEPTTPQSGRTLQSQAYTDPIPTGPRVVESLREAPRPEGEPSAPTNSSSISLGPRRIVYKPLPEYPRSALGNRSVGKPVFYLSVGSDGRVFRVRLARSSGHAELDRIAESFIRRWVYEPRPGQVEERRAEMEFVIVEG